MFYGVLFFRFGVISLLSLHPIRTRCAAVPQGVMRVTAGGPRATRSPRGSDRAILQASPVPSEGPNPPGGRTAALGSGAATSMEEGMVSVDKFSGGSQAYFLTHLHQDHTRGLGAASGWRHGPLYCSQTTARLLPTRFPGIDFSLIRPLGPGASASLSLSSPTSDRLISVQVTAIPALHCPGSLMYLFRGDLGCMLYTGDFRWELGCEKARRAKQALLNALSGDTVDVLYLDNTYCHPSLNFPPRPVVAEQMVDIVRAHPDHEVVIGVDNLGKEDLLLHISRALQTKIWVWPQRLQTIHLLGIDENQAIFTTQTDLTRVRAVPRYSFTIENLEALNTVCPTIGIMPSGIPWLWKNCEDKGESKGRQPAEHNRFKGRNGGTVGMDYDPLSPPKLFEKYAYTLPYSEHACFSELKDFMQTVQPSTVIGIVKSSFCYVNPRHYFRHLCGDNDVHVEKSPAKNKGGDTGHLTPKRRPDNLMPKRSPNDASTSPKERKFRISSSSLYRSKVATKRKECDGARIDDTEEVVCVA